MYVSADLCEGHGDTLGVFLQLIEDGVVTKLEHEVQLPLPPEHLDQVHQVRVLEVLEHPDLPERDLLDQGIVLALHELLDGHEVPGVPGPALVHHPIAALAYLTQLLIPGNIVEMRKKMKKIEYSYRSINRDGARDIVSSVL